MFVRKFQGIVVMNTHIFVLQYNEMAD